MSLRRVPSFGSPGLALALACVCATACTNNNTTPVVPCGPDSFATSTADLVFVTNYEAGLYFAAIDPIPVSLFTFGVVATAASTPQSVTAASAVAMAAGNNFPNGCVRATANQNVVTFVLTNCAGPFDITNLSGIVVATLTATGNGTVQAQLTGAGLMANGATMNLNTSATAAVSASGQKTLVATSMTSGTGPDGNSLVHSGSYTVMWPTGTNCATIDANLTGTNPTVVTNGASTIIMNYVTCKGMCPRSGSSTTTATANGQSVTLTFNGTSTAMCSASNGQTAAVPLRCP
jgi:hypothetical protein